MGTNIRVAIIPADDTEPIKIEHVTADLDWLREQVGGWIEAVRFTDEVHGYCNEEGKLIGLPLNLRATVLWQVFNPTSDVLCGNIVLFGSLDQPGGRMDGEEHDLPVSFISSQLAALGAEITT